MSVTRQSGRQSEGTDNNTSRIPLTCAHEAYPAPLQFVAGKSASKKWRRLLRTLFFMKDGGHYVRANDGGYCVSIRSPWVPVQQTSERCALHRILVDVRLAIRRFTPTSAPLRHLQTQNVVTRARGKRMLNW